MCYPHGQRSSYVSPPAVTLVHRLSRTRCRKVRVFRLTRAIPPSPRRPSGSTETFTLCERCNDFDIFSDFIRQILGSHGFETGTRRREIRCQLCDETLTAYTRVTSCFQCYQAFLGYVVLLQRRGRDFDALPNPKIVIYSGDGI